MFQVDLLNPQPILVHVSRKMRLNFIHTLLGDKFLLETEFVRSDEGKNRLPTEVANICSVAPENRVFFGAIFVL